MIYAAEVAARLPAGYSCVHTRSDSSRHFLQVQEVFGQCSKTCDVILHVQSQEFDLKVIAGHFNLAYSVILWATGVIWHIKYKVYINN